MGTLGTLGFILLGIAMLMTIINGLVFKVIGYDNAEEKERRLKPYNRVLLAAVILALVATALLAVSKFSNAT